MSQAHLRGQPRSSAARSLPRWLSGRRRKALCALLLGLGLAFGAQADAPPLALDGSEQGLDLRPHLQLLRDPGGRLTPEQAMAAEQPFAPAPDLNLGFSRDAVWLRLELQSRAERARAWQIEFGYAPLDRIELFSERNGSLQRQIGGDSVPAGQRSSEHLSPAFRVRLEPGEQRVLYFRAQSSGNLSLDARIWQAEAFARHSRLGLMLQSAYCGLWMALAGYNLMLFLAVRERSLLLYALFVASLGCAMLAYGGLGAEYLWSAGGEFGNRALPLSLALAMAAATLFARDFLGTRAALPRWHRALRLAAAAQLGVALGTLLLPLGEALPVLAVSAGAGILLLLACGLRGLPGSPAARIFVVAELPLMLGALLLVLHSFALLPPSLFTIHGIQLGAALEMLLLSCGMAARLRRRRIPRERRAGAASGGAGPRGLEQGQERPRGQGGGRRAPGPAEGHARLSQLALQDPLTGVANRAGLNLRLAQAWQQAHQRQELLALILLDLDGFKAVNDRHGHAIGDLLLTQVAARLQASARATDLVARLGGDEFVLICEAIDNAEQALALAERILHSLGQPMQLGELRLSLSASIGISICNGQSYESLLHEADQAMYLAKADGRSRIHLRQSGTPPGVPQAGLA